MPGHNECRAPSHEPDAVRQVTATGLLGIFSDPGHILAYTDGETRQEYEVILLGRPVDGAPAANDEASDVGWFLPDQLKDVDIHPTQWRQLDHYLHGTHPHIDGPTVSSCPAEGRTPTSGVVRGPSGRFTAPG